MPGNPFFQQRLVRTFRTAVILAVVIGASLPWSAASARQPAAGSGFTIGAGARIADGVMLYRPNVAGIAGLPQPLAVQALVLDPQRVDLTTALALGRQQGRATVSEAARREHAIAAVNAGFFALASGDPSGVLRVDGDLVSDARLMRGAVAIATGPRGLRLTFDRLRVRVMVDVRADGAWRAVALDGVDAVRRLGGATLYTPRFGASTGTPLTGVEWTLAIDRASHVSRTSLDATITRMAAVDTIGKGASAIPAAGAVLSFGGERPSSPLDRLALKSRLRLRQVWEAETPTAADAFARADDVVGGAGLLLRGGRTIDDWSVERTSESLRTVRHPRTMLGVDQRGAIWLVTVDGRQPGYSVGVTMLELQVLARALGLTDALNLDGGGSTTMVVNDQVVNRPSDATGPRTVSDALLVRPRPAPRPGAPR